MLSHPALILKLCVKEPTDACWPYAVLQHAVLSDDKSGICLLQNSTKIFWLLVIFILYKDAVSGQFPTQALRMQTGKAAVAKSLTGDDL